MNAHKHVSLILSFSGSLFLSCSESASSSRSRNTISQKDFQKESTQGEKTQKAASSKPGQKSTPQVSQIPNLEASKAQAEPTTEDTQSLSRPLLTAQETNMKAAIDSVIQGPEANKLAPDQKKQLADSLADICLDAAQGQAVDSKKSLNVVLAALNGGLDLGNILSQAPTGGTQIPNLGGSQNQLGQGGADLAKAIQDLVNAAQNADVDGILKAVQDIVAAV